MKKINQFIDKLSKNNRFEIFAPYFRVFICIYLLKDIVINYSFYDLFYKGTSFLYPGPSSILNFFSLDTNFLREYFGMFYIGYIILIFLFMFGIGKRYTAILLFFSAELVQSLSWITLNGGDNLFKFIMVYYIFIDSYSRLSIKPLAYKNQEYLKLSNLFSNLAGYSICIHFCIVYLVSVLHKVHADVWFNGIATYYIFSSERFRGTSWNLSLIKRRNIL